jgi:ADP-ribose pyrophosphatase YjhB (NUDIX family)
MKEKWLQWAAELQSIAQAGLTFCNDRYDLDRYRQIRDLSVEILHQYTEVSHEKIKELFANETGYQTPKVDIRSAVFKDDSILLVRERVDGKWALPGGWADVNRSPGEAAVKECYEEAGAKVTPKRIIAIQLANRHVTKPLPFSIYKIFIECELIENNFIENTETLEAGFFRYDSLPELSNGRSTKEQIEMCFEARKMNILEAHFD